MEEEGGEGERFLARFFRGLHGYLESVITDRRNKRRRGGGGGGGGRGRMGGGGRWRRRGGGRTILGSFLMGTSWVPRKRYHR